MILKEETSITFFVCGINWFLWLLY